MAHKSETKYTIYHDFASGFRNLKGHQVLAINRAQKEKIISMKVDMDKEKVHA